jgi:hypothetical protein
MSIPRVRLGRAAVLATTGLIGVNLATAGRWAEVPGALRGWRWPYICAALVAASLLALRPSQPRWSVAPWLSRTIAALGAIVLAVCLLVAWFPPSSWPLIPFLDDWPPRFSSTVEGVRLLLHGTFVGWQWNLLGGYSTATDITQSLTLLGAVPMLLFGNEAGFHLLHIALFCAVPLFAFFDLRRDGAASAAPLAAGFVALAVAGQGWTLIRSGDTNSLCGLFAVMLVLAASGRARGGRRFGFSCLVAALAVAAFAHVGFYAYAVGLLLLEAAYYRDYRLVPRALGAAALAFLVSLPLTYELVRYPHLFVSNNVIYEPPSHVNWLRLLRRVGYNTEILFLPWRWFNDPQGLTSLFLPLLLFVAWRRDGRVGFHAWSALLAFGLLRFNVPEAGYIFMRPEHLLAVFTPVAVAGFVATEAKDRWLAASLAVVVALCFQVTWIELPHRRSVDDFVPDLVARLKTLDGNLVVVENNPHRDVAAGTGVRSERSLYGVHYEALLPGATGRRLYAGYWDGWQWTRARGEMLAAGAWKGRMIAEGDQAAFVAEMRRWGVRHALVWSVTSRRVFGGWDHFALRWEQGPWRQFELVDPQPDTRAVVTDHGTGELTSMQPLEGRVRLAGVRRGDRVVVRTRFHPAWSVAWERTALEAVDAGGQLGFVAPADGSYEVRLIYPARRWLLLLSLLTLCLAAIAEWRVSRGAGGVVRRAAAATSPA